MTTLTQAQAFNLLDELAAEIEAQLPPPIADDEVTAPMLAAKTGNDAGRVKEWLELQVKLGVLTKHDVIGVNRRVVVAYRKAQP